MLMISPTNEGRACEDWDDRTKRASHSVALFFGNALGMEGGTTDWDNTSGTK
jgi:hypothetical protein